MNAREEALERLRGLPDTVLGLLLSLNAVTTAADVFITTNNGSKR